MYAIDFYLCLLGSFQRSSPVIFITLGRHLGFFIFPNILCKSFRSCACQVAQDGNKSQNLPWFMRCRSPGVVGSPVHSSPHSGRSPNHPECLGNEEIKMDIGVGKTCFVLMYCLFFQGIHLCNFLEICMKRIETICRLLRLCGDIWVYTHVARWRSDFKLYLMYLFVRKNIMHMIFFRHPLDWFWIASRVLPHRFCPNKIAGAYWIYLRDKRVGEKIGGLIFRKDSQWWAGSWSFWGNLFV